jgi:hypothetical protein
MLEVVEHDQQLEVADVAGEQLGPGGRALAQP